MVEACLFHLHVVLPSLELGVYLARVSGTEDIRDRPGAGLCVVRKLAHLEPFACIQYIRAKGWYVLWSNELLF